MSIPIDKFTSCLLVEFVSDFFQNLSITVLAVNTPGDITTAPPDVTLGPTTATPGGANNVILIASVVGACGGILLIAVSLIWFCRRQNVHRLGAQPTGKPFFGFLPNNNKHPT